MRSGPHERRGEQRVQRNHVRHDADGARAELGPERRDELHAALRLRRRAEQPDDDVVRRDAGTTESHSTTSSSTRSASARTMERRLGEHRIGGIELLCREDEAAH